MSYKFIVKMQENPISLDTQLPNFMSVRVVVGMVILYMGLLITTVILI